MGFPEAVVVIAVLWVGKGLVEFFVQRQDDLARRSHEARRVFEEYESLKSAVQSTKVNVEGLMRRFETHHTVIDNLIQQVGEVKSAMAWSAKK